MTVDSGATAEDVGPGDPEPSPVAAPTDSVRFDLRYREAGSGPIVVLVHGFPTDGQVFEGQLDAARSGALAARIVAVDLPGFGETPFDPDGVATPEILDVEILAESLANVIRRLTPGTVVVGGVAIGGYVCIELASRHPELVAGLVLSGTKAAPDNPAMAEQRKDVAKLAFEDGSLAVADKLAGHPLGPNASDADRDRLHALIAAAEPRGIAALVQGLARRPDPTPALEALRVPALVISGSADPFVTEAESKRLVEVTPDARLVVLDGVGHVVPFEAPEAYCVALAEFLAGLPTQK
ncbi:MAG: hypothetical protein QOH61_2039 [Chloroflexota bacterium]|jgi:pimeloyl-ACP methyl ester carboxylesterase|nr:hypothetical protein [Chloroflexota bacterium]